MSKYQRPYLPIVCVVFTLAILFLLLWPPSKSSSSIQSETLRVAIIDLTQAVARLDGRISDGIPGQERPSGNMSSGTERSAIGAATIEELTEQLVELNEMLQGLGESLKDSGLYSSSREELAFFDSMDRYPQKTDALVGLKGKDKVTLALKHLNWSYEQVLRAYGKPSHVFFNNGGLNFAYNDLPGKGHVNFFFEREQAVGITAYWKK